LFSKLCSDIPKIIEKDIPNLPNDIAIGCSTKLPSTNENLALVVSVVKSKTLQIKSIFKIRDTVSIRNVGRKANLSGGLSTNTKHFVNLSFELAAGVTVGYKEKGRGVNIHSNVGNVDIVKDRFSFQGRLGFDNKGWTVSGAGVVKVTNDILIGAGGDVVGHDGEWGLDKVMIKSRYKRNSFSANFSGDHKPKEDLTKLTIGFRGEKNDVEVAADFKLSDNEDDSISLQSRLAFVQQLDPDSILKTRISVLETGQTRLGFVYQSILSKSSKLVAGADFNTASLLGKEVKSTENHCFKLSISLD